MAKKMKRLEVSFTPIKKDIEKAISALRGFKSKVSTTDKKEIDLQIKLLNKAIKEVKTACDNKKMTPGFNVA
ncbi:MAG: hypothetical protein JO260_02545 [Acidobacteria bacterium]|nr:hypothetical protein [Acidobacteriota bacterium]